MSYWVSEQSIKVILFYPKPEANTLYAYHNLWIRTWEAGQSSQGSGATFFWHQLFLQTEET